MTLSDYIDVESTGLDPNIDRVIEVTSFARSPYCDEVFAFPRAGGLTAL